MAKFRFIRNHAERLFRQYGYDEILLNIVEHEELFHRTLGDTSEIIQKQMYSFKDAAGRNLVLRPEGTAGIARMFVEKNLFKAVLPKKLYYIGPMFRYEKPQSGRLRQFYQFGVEYFGNSHVSADAEIIALAYDFLQAVKPADYTIEINNLGDLESRKRYCAILLEFFKNSERYDKLSDLSKSRIQLGNPLRILDSKESGDLEASKGCPKISEYLSKESITEFRELQETLKALEVPFVLDENLVRGLDYYTKTCFEIKIKSTDPSKERMRDTLIGGGRYDLLIGQLAREENKDMPAIGFAAGFERIAMLLDTEQDKKNYLPLDEIKIGVLPIYEKDDEAMNALINNKALQLARTSAASDRRNSRKKFSIEIISHHQRLDKRLNYIGRREYNVAVMVGKTEIEKQQLKVKNLQTGDQQYITLNNDFLDVILSKF